MKNGRRIPSGRAADHRAGQSDRSEVGVLGVDGRGKLLPVRREFRVPRDNQPRRHLRQLHLLPRKAIRYFGETSLSSSGTCGDTQVDNLSPARPAGSGAPVGRPGGRARQSSPAWHGRALAGGSQAKRLSIKRRAAQAGRAINALGQGLAGRSGMDVARRSSCSMRARNTRPLGRGAAIQVGRPCSSQSGRVLLRNRPGYKGPQQFPFTFPVGPWLARRLCAHGKPSGPAEGTRPA